MKRRSKVCSFKFWSVLLLGISFSSLILLTSHKASASTGDIYTVSGTGTGNYSGDGGPSAAAGLKTPAGISVDASGNIYIADRGDQRIRKIDIAGNISTIAGTGVAGYLGDGGLAATASISNPTGVCVNSSGEVFFADTDNCVIRKINASGIIFRFAGGGKGRKLGDGQHAVNAWLKYPEAVAVDSQGNVYIADTGNNRVRKVNALGVITTVAGNGKGGYSGDGGPATSAGIDGPKSIALDLSGNIYIADSNNNRVRKVDASGIITTVAGDGVARYSGDGGAAASASLNGPAGLALDSAGNIFIADLGNNTVRKVDTSGTITTAAGTGTAGFLGDGGQAASALLYNPCGLAVDSYGDVFVTDSLNNRVRMIVSASYPLPISAITAPQSGGQVFVKENKITGQASALNGVSFVEVSTDGGTTWYTGSGTDQWTYNWNPQAAGSYYILSRANDSLNGKARFVACSIATAVAETEPPASRITAPAQGAVLTGTSCSVTGTATDGTGTGVASVEVSVNGGASWSTASGTTSWSYAWTLPSNGTYILMSRAKDSAGNIETPTASASVTVSQPVPVPPVVANSPTPSPASATAGATVTWTASASGGTGSYLYQFQRMGPDTGGAFTVVQDYGTSNKWSWITTSAMAGVNYITVNVKNSDGSGSASSASAPYTLSEPAPAVPSNQAVLTWSASTSTGVVGYKVYWGTVSGSYTQQADAGKVTTYTVASLSPGTYYFVTTAYDSTGKESGYSNEVSKVIPAQATLTWTASTSAGVSGYKVYYGTASGVYTSSVSVGNLTTYSLNGLSSGTTYYLATTAYDSSGKESGYSNQVSKVMP